MMMFGTKCKQGDIVIVPFPFTDLSSIKQRPVLILSSDKYNESTEDIIVCGITSNPKNTAHSVIITLQDLAEGRIPSTSRIKADKLFTLKQTLIRSKIGAVRPAILKKVQEEIKALLG